MRVDRLREQIVEEAKHRCGYCLTPQVYVTAPFELEHLRPKGRGGPTVRENLWLACRFCNACKADRLSATDPVSGRRVRLFNPRRQRWERHFRWNGVLIEGITPTGRATVDALRLNDRVQVSPRELWLLVGLFPFGQRFD